MAEEMEKISPLYQRIYTLIQQIPPGYVCSYGRIGQQLGCTARTVGFALAALPVRNNVPWQRVINSQGKVSPRANGYGDVLQRDLLESEGVGFDEKQRIDLSVYGWTFLADTDGLEGAKDLEGIEEHS
jgi:methylated-DNA-protein-cysteine methyltransferase-like protein